MLVALTLADVSSGALDDFPSSQDETRRPTSVVDDEVAPARQRVERHPDIPSAGHVVHETTYLFPERSHDVEGSQSQELPRSLVDCNQQASSDGHGSPSEPSDPALAARLTETKANAGNGTSAGTESLQYAQVTTSPAVASSTKEVTGASSSVISPTAHTVLSPVNSNEKSIEPAHSVQHSRALAAGLLSGALVLLLIAIALTVFLLRRKRRSKDREMCEILDKVTGPPPRPRRPSFSAVSKESIVPELAPTVDIPIVPTLDISRLHPQDIDLEANSRHSAELTHQKIVGHTVSRDMSFNWRFPKLSVPPAAARAFQSAHYVKKRSTIASPPSFRSLSPAIGSPSLSLSSAAELAFGNSNGYQSSTGATTSASVCVHDASLTMSNSSKSAAPSSSCVDPLVDHNSCSFLASPGSHSRTRWWSSSLQGFARSPLSQRSQRSTPRTASALTTHSDSSLSSQSHSTPPSPIGGVLNDPVMQQVMMQVLALASGREVPSPPRTHTSLPDFEQVHTVGDEYILPARHSSCSQRRVSRASSALETCRESSQERFETTHVDEIKTASSPTEERPSPVSLPSTPKNSRSISAAYSAHSIVIHQDNSDESGLIRRQARAQVASMPVKMDPRRSLTPKILLTSTEEDGSHERQLSMTSIESTTSGSITSGNDDGEESDESVYASHSMIPITSSNRSSNGDVASAIGEAFLAHMTAERRFARQRSFEKLTRSRLDRDSDSTIDSLTSFHQHRQAMLAKSDSFEGAFNDAFSEAASALSESMMDDDEDTQGSDSTGTFDDDKSVVTARPDSMTQSESEVAACLMDDDLPTIPTWKSISTQRSYATMETSEAVWRSASSMSIATIRQ